MIGQLGFIEDGDSGVEWKGRHYLGTSLRRELRERLGDVGGAHAGEYLRQLRGVVMKEIEEFRGGRGDWCRARHHGTPLSIFVFARVSF